MKEAKKTKIGYKVVKKENGRFCSYTSSIEFIDLRSCVEYILGRTSKPKSGSGPLCVFRTLNQARQCYDSSFGVAILKVRYVPSKKRSVWVTRYLLSKNQSIRVGRFIRMTLKRMPKGTVLADSVTPIKEMVIE